MKTQLTLSKNAINKAIMAFEVSWTDNKNGFYVYNNKYSHPCVPDPEHTFSGVTIGIGFDCGQTTADNIYKTWGSILPLHDVDRLAKCAGLKKLKAVEALKSVADITVPIGLALQVFYNTTIYNEAKAALSIYPGLPGLHPVEQTVIVGLVYNRGTALEESRRKEMKDLIEEIKNHDSVSMSNTIRSMCRLWPDSKGLIARRVAEANLVSLPDTPIPESDKLILLV